MKTLLLSLAALALLTHTAAAQIPAASTGGSAGTTPSSASSDQETQIRFWQATFPNGHYLVKLDRIVSASKHEYVSDGVARVVEVTIGTDSAVVARFYFFEPVGRDTPIAAGQIIMDRAQQVAQTAAAKVSPSAAKLQVVKNYPSSTHAHTVEYALQSEAELSSLYTSLMTAINTGRGRIWKASQ